MIIPFGKHQGEDFKSLPSDYLTWMARERNNKGDVIRNGVNWTEEALQELAKRGSTPRGVPAKPKVEQSSLPWSSDKVDFDSPVPVVDATESPTDYAVRMVRSGEFELGVAAIDDAVDFLMKEYLLRVARQDKFSVWLKNYIVEEAGHKTTKMDRVTDQSGKMWAVDFTSKTLKFRYKIPPGQIVAVSKCKN